MEKSGVSASGDILSDILECLKCEHRFLTPVLSEEVIGYYYSIIGSEYYDTVRENPIDRNYLLTQKIGKIVKREVSEGAEILEIGCGLGHLLKSLNDMGYKCSGVEPNVSVSSMARQLFGLNIESEILSESTFPHKKFDLIILNDVIEHIYDVRGLFEVIKFYMKEGGKIFVLTGNSKSFYSRIFGRKWMYFYSWEHISFFNRNSIKFLFGEYNITLNKLYKIEHSGSTKKGLLLFYYSLRALLTNAIGFRKNYFFHMAFDHMIAIGSSNNSGNLNE